MFPDCCTAILTAAQTVGVRPRSRPHADAMLVATHTYHTAWLRAHCTRAPHGGSVRCEARAGLSDRLCSQTTPESLKCQSCSRYQGYCGYNSTGSECVRQSNRCGTIKRASGTPEPDGGQGASTPRSTCCVLVPCLNQTAQMALVIAPCLEKAKHMRMQTHIHVIRQCWL